MSLNLPPADRAPGLGIDPVGNRPAPTRSAKQLPLVPLLVIAGFGLAALGCSDREDEATSSGKGQETLEIPTLDAPDPRIPATPGKSWEEIDDPSKDGWDTEVFTGKAMKQLKALGKLVTHPDDISSDKVAALVTGDFASEPLKPDGLNSVYEDDQLTITRAPIALAQQDFREPPAADARMEFKGPDGLAEALRAAAEPFTGAADLRFKAKVFRVSASTEEVATRQYFSLSGRTDEGALERNATWDIGWARSADGGLPRMRWLRVVEFEEVVSSQPGGALFTDCTESVLGGNEIYGDQFLRGMNHWFRRIQDRSPLELFGNPGLAVGDVNGDGLDDLYVCQESGLPNRLFIQNPDGTATEEAAARGVDWLQSSRSALFADLDNDGDQDLAVAVHGGVVVAENDGEGHFRFHDVLAATTDTMSLSAADYDLDGRLDLYVCGYNQSQRVRAEDSGLGGSSSGFVVHDANNGGNNSLFRNESTGGEWQFTDVTATTGLNENNSRWSLAAAWEDYDNDGDLDLYVANDYGRDNFYRNDAGEGGARTFVDISDTAQVEDSGTGMAITWGDYNRDGLMDAFVANMWSSAGNRIAYQDQFLADSTPEHRHRIQQLARGNTLLQNQGDGSFGDQSNPAGIEMGRWAWGSNFFDFNNDGWEDLIVSNGYISTEDTGDL